MTRKKPENIHFVPHIVGKRFFTVPQFGKTADEPVLKAHLLQPDEPVKQVKGKRKMRYAAYVRISSEDQVGNFSIDAQKRAIKQWVKAQENGALVKTYIDEAQSGRTSNRPEFQRMRRDAKKRKYDALVVHKFDRFARNRTDALAIKSLLRHDYDIKIFSVSEPSEDSDGPIGALIEGIMEAVADWYSRNLSAETAKGKLERAMQGYHNNNPPFGMDKSEDSILVPNEKELEGLKHAFELYSTGKQSDNAIAHVLNEKGYKSKSGRPFSTDTVRDMLQNRTYLGYVKYQAYKRHADGRRRYDTPVKWFKGKHEAVIQAELFDRCQKIRHSKAVHHEYYPKHRTYLLRDIVFCAECVESMPEDTQDDAYGKMRPHTNNKGANMYYRCRARDFTRSCSQISMYADAIEQQVVDTLKTLKPPPDWRERIVNAMGDLLGEQKLEQRLAEIKEVIERMDFRWDNGFITDKDAYLEQRIKLQQELEQLTPIPDNDLATAADVLKNFEIHWEAASSDRKEQQRLIQLIVARVWVRDDTLVAMSLRPNYHVTLGMESKKPTKVAVGLKQDGDDTLVPRRERRGWFAHWVHAQTFIWSPHNRVYHLVIRELVEGVQS